MSVVQADNPCTIARRPLPRAHIVEPSMGGAEIQKENDFRRGQMPLLNRHADAARAGDVSVDIGAKAGLGPSLHRLPLTQIGFVLVGLHVFPRLTVSYFTTGRITRDACTCEWWTLLVAIRQVVSS